MNETINESTQTLILPDKWYKRSKWFIVIVIPACGTLYFALSQIWGLPSGEQILGTLIAFQAFLGTVFAVSTAQYNNSDAKYSGDINVTETPEKLAYSLDLKDDPEDLKNKDEVTFKVNSP